MAGKMALNMALVPHNIKKVAKVSKATATRHLSDLLEKACIVKLEGGGRNTRYQINTQL